MHTSRFIRIAEIAGSEFPDPIDTWGETLSLHFAIAAVLDMSDVEGDVTPEPFARWQYSRAPFAIPALETVAARAEDYSEGEYADDYTYPEISLASALLSGEISQSDLIYAGDVLDRYAAVLRNAGKDY